MLAIYPVRPGLNEELRYSLRSLENLPEIDGVWIVGDMPDWCKPDRRIPGNTQSTGQANVYHNILVGCRVAAELGHKRTAVFNDDMYATEMVERIPNMYRSTLDEHLALPRVRRARGQWWPTSLELTRVCLQAHGIESPLSYELHTPFVCDPALMYQALDMMRHVTPDAPPQWRSIYGNLHHVDAAKAEDGKVYGPGEVRKPWFSTEDASYPHHADALAALYPQPSRWEQQ